MVRRREVIRTISRAAEVAGVEWKLDREGANHSVFRLGSSMIPIPRHAEIDRRLAEMIFKECETQLGRRWWM